MRGIKKELLGGRTMQKTLAKVLDKNRIESARNCRKLDTMIKFLTKADNELKVMIDETRRITRR